MISNARQKLIQLEEDTRAAELRPAPNREPAPPSGPIQNDLFIAPVPSEVEQRLATVEPDELSPRAALELLYELKRLAR